MRIITLVIPICFLLVAEAKRVEIRPRIAEPQVYYEEDSQADEDDYNPAVYQPRTRALPSPRSKDALHSSKPPPVQTIRNYNKVNDDGSFTFGYEAADGSFKEETRGTDCVVRGKYGYIDPDGNKREFTYVSGNPCDPNAPKDDEDDVEKQEEDDLNGPANYPAVRPVPRPVPVRPTYQQSTTRAPTTIFQTQYRLDDDASQELGEDDLVKPTQLRQGSYRTPQQPTYVQVTPSSALYEPSPTASPGLYRLASSTTQYQSTASPVLRTQPTTSYQTLETTTRRPVTRHPKPQSVAITPRPHVAQVAAQYVSPSSTERTALAYNRPSAVTVSPNLRSTTVSSASHLDFAAELERYVNTVGVASPKPGQASAAPSKVRLSGQTPITASAADPIYQSELVYDPSTGQYNTQLYQTLPQTVGDFTLSHKLQPFVAQPQSYLGLQQLQQLQPQQPQRQTPLYKQPASQPAQSSPGVAVNQPQEVLYRKQQSQLLQQSQQLYAQQQRRQQQQQQQQQPVQSHRLQLLESQTQPQSFYYVAPARSSNAASAPLSVGQIDQYLRASAAHY
ncbi:mediator of RNA polymerase II transcription subunit 12-like isoform X1 [Osmia bicornis bicornis]|uniref:mediator of RNA polymerase II transcription subunit 12-like isoform X1 n=1 Tax=Osmia bicornis bicornis TaxID=1437191 RepID=UPI001EAF2944|nr:mediator of RNA polymerase II transcription subunit 12-like isoform X1 [Osmia bicornis bicornis]